MAYPPASLNITFRVSHNGLHKFCCVTRCQVMIAKVVAKGRLLVSNAKTGAGTRLLNLESRMNESVHEMECKLHI